VVKYNWLYEVRERVTAPAKFWPWVYWSSRNARPFNRAVRMGSGHNNPGVHDRVFSKSSQ
jgi:hypothetical protein